MEVRSRRNTFAGGRIATSIKRSFRRRRAVANSRSPEAVSSPLPTGPSIRIHATDAPQQHSTERTVQKVQTTSSYRNGENSLEAVRNTAHLWNQPYMCRTDVSDLLSWTKPGVFIVRSSSKKGSSALSVLTPFGHVDHFLIQQMTSGLFCLQSSEKRFNSITELLAHYCDHDSTGLPCRLQVPFALANLLSSRDYREVCQTSSVQSSDSRRWAQTGGVSRLAEALTDVHISVTPVDDSETVTPQPKVTARCSSLRSSSKPLHCSHYTAFQLLTSQPPQQVGKLPSSALHPVASTPPNFLSADDSADIYEDMGVGQRRLAVPLSALPDLAADDDSQYVEMRPGFL